MGYGLQTTGWVIMVQTAVAIIFQFLGGWIGDRIPKNVALFIFTAIQGIGVVFLTLGPEMINFYAFAVLFGIGFGGRTPLTTAIRGDYFGRASFGSSEEHTSELQSQAYLVCRLLLEKKKQPHTS